MAAPAGGVDAIGGPELSAADFRRVAELTKDVAGINLTPGKEGLVRARLARRLRAHACASFADYLDLVAADATHGELKEMVDALTTNKTSFFREAQHFDYLVERVFPDVAAAGRAPRLWSAGCSSGEEPYTLAMVVREAMPAPLADATRILGTDISARVLARAAEATYGADIEADVERARLRPSASSPPSRSRACCALACRRTSPPRSVTSARSSRPRPRSRAPRTGSTAT